ncbi:hypothetical protein HFO09_14100 [Rhizobium laguerreae]|uniref:hypothetical protein n=1 Tax=Rhizobium laguerreae TaxID=1076926 RepID=UPI001C901A8D|nr:hypothetical protein [Rhizobium laguerreae]MBY3254540.1 hypothetical protein [Rhizobium laguerreae]MBY3283857.1 hypothetical protein [Rhizobium laguerreae]MBY3290199.1 hypothetical protein [Rhizobium laguerreae]
MIKTRIDPSDCKKCVSARLFFGNAFPQVTAINLIGNVVSRRAMHTSRYAKSLAIKPSAADIDGGKKEDRGHAATSPHFEQRSRARAIADGTIAVPSWPHGHLMVRVILASAA